MTRLAVSRSIGNQLVGLIGWTLLTFAAAAVGALASTQADTFYAQLERPVWAPPGWLFAPVWTILYLLMAVSAWLVWRVSGLRGAAPALGLFAAQLAANALWSWLFFVWHQGGWAFIEVLVLWALIASTGVAFWRHQPVAGVLLLPYLAWVGFAAALTLAAWRLNPTILG